MLGNYLKTAIRGFLKHKGFTLINLVGLAVGIAGSLAVFLWVADEVSYDRFHSNIDDLYRCYCAVDRDGELRYTAVTSAPIGPALAGRTPDILDYVRIMDVRLSLRYENQGVERLGGCVDPPFLELFSFPLVEGDVKTALSSPNSIVLTQTMATSLFEDQDPIGKVLNNGLIVTGVAADVPHNSSIQFDFLVPFAYGEQVGLVSSDQWLYFSYWTFFQLRPQADVAAVGNQIRDLFAETAPEENIELFLQPFGDVHLRDLGGGGRIVNIYVFSLVAILILAVACINFMNLATARAETRMTEIALKKVIGASRRQLATQVLFESAVQTTIGVVLAVCLLEAVLPYSQSVIGKRLVFEPSLSIILALAVVALFTALVAGAYPALLLSSFKPAAVLKGKSSTGGRREVSFVRRSLVVFQFTVSTVLIFGALVINGQLSLIEKKDLGIKRDNIVVLNTNGPQSDWSPMKDELSRQPGILGVAGVYEPPAWCGWYNYGFDYDGKSDGRDIRSGIAFVDHDYVDVFGLEIVEGRNFSKEFATDEAEGVLINETAVRAMGMSEPIGKTIEIKDSVRQIIGVVRDFHFASLHDAIGPLIIRLQPSDPEYLCIRVAEGGVSGTLAYIERQWERLMPGEEFEYSFFEDLLGREYYADVRTGNIVLGFTILAVFVACLGLFGLAAFGAGRRRKEIGIRKVHGASLGQLVRLMSREYFVLVLISSAIAGPIAYWVMNGWLQSFAYRIEAGWYHFLFSSTLVLIIATITVSYQAIRAATANPIEALRSE